VLNTHCERYLLTENPKGLVRISLRDSALTLKLTYINKLPVILFLALSFLSAFAHADDSSLTKEANAALAQKDYSSAFSKFTVLAQHGNAIAQFNLGAFYLNGQGVQKDDKQAFGWFAKSAAQGNARALQVIQSAAARGNENATIELNKIQPHGQLQQSSSVAGDEKSLWAAAHTALAQKDYSGAFSIYTVLAQHGNAIAQFNLGACYINGQGVQKDEKQAFDWFEKSAVQGNTQALQVIQSAAARGNAIAQYSLGDFYLNGQGVQSDEKQAFDWLTKSAAQGSIPALQVIQKAAANGNALAKSAYAGLTQATDGASLLNKPDVKDETNTTTFATHTGFKDSRKSSSSNFSLGASVGQTGKLTGIDNSTSFGVLAGYKFNSSWGVELAYNSLYQNANADNFISAANPGMTGIFNLNLTSVTGQYIYSIASRWSLLGNLGYHSSGFTLKNASNASLTGKSSGMVVGLKAQYDLSKSIGIRGGIDSYSESGDITGILTEVGLAVIYQF
jgi:TPR repeat protein